LGQLGQRKPPFLKIEIRRPSRATEYGRTQK
jgi:hypothetical protein